MLKLDKSIEIGGISYTHMLLVKGDFDLRVPYVELYPALVRDTGKVLLLGQWRLTDAGMQPEYTETLAVIRLAPQRDDEGNLSPEQEALVVALRMQFFTFLEGIENIVVGLQADLARNRLTPLKIALTKFPLSCTFEPLGDRGIGVDVVDERTNAPAVEELPEDEGEKT